MAATFDAGDGDAVEELHHAIGDLPVASQITITGNRFLRLSNSCE